MDLQNFAAAMQARGCAADGKRTFCGVYGRLPYTAVFTGGTAAGQTTFTLRVQFASNVKPKIYRTLSKQFKGEFSVRRTNGAASVCLLCTVRARQADTALDALLAAVARQAEELSLSPPSACPICKLDGCDSYAYHGTAFLAAAYVPVHAACVHSLAEARMEKVRQNETDGSYALGAVGAVIGGALGSAPSILLALFAGYITAWLCALIPLGAYFGYKLLRGKMSRAVLPLVLAVSAVMAPVFSYLIAGFEVYMGTDGEFFPPPANYISALAGGPARLLDGSSYYMAQNSGITLWSNLGMALLFTGIGVLIVSGQISRNNRSAWSEAGFTSASLRRISG